MLFLCLCCSRAHVDPVPILILRPCLSHVRVYPMSMFIPCLYISHSHVHFIPMFISSPCHMCLPHHHVYHVLIFNCVLYAALVLKDQINFDITTEYLKKKFQSISTEIK